MAPNGPTTEQFFADGDLHEGTQWKYAHLPPDDAVEANSDAQFDSFDAIPKRHRMLLAFVAIGACLLISSAAWTMVFQSTGASVAIRSWVSGVLAPHRTVLDPVEPAVAAQPSPRAAPTIVPQAAPNTRSAPLPPPQREVNASATVAARPSAAAIRPMAGGHRRLGTGSLRGFVWSPTANALVPAVLAAETDR
jgi:ABC-type protease/lipase transport system fused ATPase/permease subunit